MAVGMLMFGAVRGPESPKRKIDAPQHMTLFGSRASLDLVFRVTSPIPAFGAQAGDWLIHRPLDPDFPLELHRVIPLSALSLIDLSKLKWLDHLREPFESAFAFPFAVPQVGALPGDELIMNVEDKEDVLVLRRTFPYEMLAAVPEESVRMLYAEPSRAGQVLRVPRPQPAVPAQAALRLVG